MKTILIPLIAGLALLASVPAVLGCESELAGADMPIYDLDYDDSWVSGFPGEVAGYTVLYIHTPRTQACSRKSDIELQAPPGAEPPYADVRSEVEAMEESIPIPGGTELDIWPAEVPNPGVDRLDELARGWNASAEEWGCEAMGWGAGAGGGRLVELPDDVDLSDDSNP